MNDSTRKGDPINKIESNLGILYIVGTPIGNLNDFAPRAKSVLKEVSFIACEDTRRSGFLMKKFEIKTPLISFHKHNTKRRIPKLIHSLKEGLNIALISDSGLPIISDPGEELVLEARKNKFKIICIPGPCAATTALVSSGISAKRFCFEGFLPTQKNARKEIIDIISEEKRTIIIYESPYRLVKLLEELSITCGGDRSIQVSREITKFYEEHIGPDIESALNHFKDEKPQGEFTIILGGKEKDKPKPINEKELIIQAKKLISNGLTSREAARELSISSGQSRREIYNLIHKKN